MSTILSQAPLGFPWITLDPFLFCVHHLDSYPSGNPDMSVKASLLGRNIGSDFSYKDGWSMYHGNSVPGFPRHPHRGFETITIGRQGFIDHSDSMGATARFGAGDVQWMTAGKGVVHSEMFPMRNQNTPNPTELFQIWLNLPAKDKFVEPYFTMFWRNQIDIVDYIDDVGLRSSIQVVAGNFQQSKGPTPPPNSWASNPLSDIAILTIHMEANADLWLEPANKGTTRVLYFFRGKTLQINNSNCALSHAIQVNPEHKLHLANGDEPTEILLLQGRPIGEPVVKYGPFVMNSQQEIQQAYHDYQRTGFGGWPWKNDGPAHANTQERFAIHANGTREDAG